MFQRWAFQGIAGLTALLPMRVQYALSRPISAAYHALHRPAREAARANLRVLLGPQAPEALVRREARGMFRSFGYYLCDFFSAAHWDRAFFDAHVSVTGREHLDAALAAGRGALFCAGHYSSWELGPMVVTHMGYPCTAVVAPHADEENSRVFVEQRAQKGVTVVFSQHGATHALRALRANRTVALMGDRRTGGPLVTVDFCGRRTLLPQGPWRIAAVTGAALLPTFIVRRANHSFGLEIMPALRVPEALRTAPLAEQVQALAQGWTDAYVARLRADPSQWALFHSLWPAEDTAHPGLSGQASAERSASGDAVPPPQAPLSQGVRP